ncbi:DUF4623 domain-containing protein [candidate division KSB1 bacterium]|nr:DUF4623 domain-containing protein [candidate division KSB1 bacterium]
MFKKVLPIIFLLLSQTTYAQYRVNWTNYDVMNPGNDLTRSIAYNRQTDHVLVATRKYGTDVIILDAANGDSVGRLNTDGISGGTYPINMVSVANDGVIYVSNLIAPQYTPGATFKVYRYDSEDGAPELVFDNALDGGRYGDSFTAVGTGPDTYIYSSGMGNPNIVVLRNTGSELVLDHNIPLPSPGAARHGISPVSPGGNIWINGADTGTPPPRLITNDGTVIAEVPDSLASPGGTSCIKHLSLGNYKLVTVSNAWSISIRSVRYFEDELGTVTFDYFGSDCDSLPLLYEGNTFVNNINATASLDYDSKRHSIISLFGYNSIASMSLDSLVKASTPRPDSLTVNIDGKNDFFPTDHVGLSNGRDLFITWSEGKLFFGVTGHTLIDPTETNRMYIALDLDPDGDAGSSTAPEEAADVRKYPFKADVVYMVEPWTEPDYLIGTIYKWNGSEWTYTLFDGNMANQGALAYGDEGEGKLTEVCAVKNDVGIGVDFASIGMLAYVAEKNASGDVLCSFPENNPLGNSVSFTHFYLADSLGKNMFPTDQKYIKIAEGTVSVEQKEGEMVPTAYRLHQNYPNPFNPETRISYDLSRSAHVKLDLFDISGRHILTLLDKRETAGSHSLTVNGRQLASGIYFYKLTVDQKIISIKKMALIK